MAVKPDKKHAKKGSKKNKKSPQKKTVKRSKKPPKKALLATHATGKRPIPTQISAGVGEKSVLLGLSYSSSKFGKWSNFMKKVLFG